MKILDMKIAAHIALILILYGITNEYINFISYLIYLMVLFQFISILYMFAFFTMLKRLLIKQTNC